MYGDSFIAKNDRHLRAIVFHLRMGLRSVFDPADGYNTAIHTLNAFHYHSAAVASYAAVAVLAIAGLYYDARVCKAGVIAAQQFVVMVSAGGTLLAL